MRVDHSFSEKNIRAKFYTCTASNNLKFIFIIHSYCTFHFIFKIILCFSMIFKWIVTRLLVKLYNPVAPTLPHHPCIRFYLPVIISEYREPLGDILKSDNLGIWKKSAKFSNVRNLFGFAIKIQKYTNKTNGISAQNYIQASQFLSIDSLIRKW